ncbi:TIGR04222 domain-containing membrane protein [Embleya scabrispora]|uniref:TIGR04222 domain-containing membrane protein n=1 Tax=Embleya scabrispora TaxID=159449 RepID=UPI00036C426F|nr:TIGR04222 domain-containing membrane protein [Embleya scabrispora]MYS79524.1 TIGR04222 domain-containing membrane protein [Streptomyces sp. SID5474]
MTMNPWLPPLAYSVWTALVLGVAIGSARRGGKRADRRRLAELDLVEYAFVSGGAARAADVCVLRLLGTGSLHLSRDGQVVAARTPEPGAAPDAPLRVLDEEYGGLPLRELRVRVAASPEIQAIGTALLAAGLVARPDAGPRRVPRWALFATMALGVATAVAGFVRADDGAASARPWVGLLLAVIGIQACLAGLLLLGVFGERVVPTAPTMRRLIRMRRDEAAVDALGAGGVGAVALWGLDRFPDPVVKEIFRRNAPAPGSRDPRSTWCGSTSCASPQGARAGSCGGTADGCGG